MQQVKVRITEDDLTGHGFHITDCPGFRGTKRVLPQLQCFGFDWCFLSFPDHVRASTKVNVPPEASNILKKHAKYQKNKLEGVKAQPFEFILQVPDEAEVADGQD